jgi:NTE family protein
VQTADLVLEGGGVKGLGLVGAVLELMDGGYTFARVAGTSAGSIVAAVLAAGATKEQLDAIMRRLDYGRVPDGGNLFSESLALTRRSGLHPGHYIRRFIADELEDLGITTFGQLRVDDDPLDDPALPNYRLVVTATDLTTGTLLRLPWDYTLLGLAPDEQPVADAVRASMSIPLFFEPVEIAGHTLVDGGLLSNFPIEIFDRTDREAPRWPTLGVKVMPDPSTPLFPDLGIPPLRLLGQAVATTLNGHDQTYLNRPCVSRRAIRVDTGMVGIVDFRVGGATRTRVVESGRRAAREFLATWSFDAYKRECRA